MPQDGTPPAPKQHKSPVTCLSVLVLLFFMLLGAVAGAAAVVVALKHAPFLLVFLAVALLTFYAAHVWRYTGADRIFMIVLLLGGCLAAGLVDPDLQPFLVVPGLLMGALWGGAIVCAVTDSREG
ncbi:MAG: hypothetical protein ACYTAF_11385 [Planctomycetota bacterium]|jgi:ABC-type Na+ efflux pump permease subunit